MKYRQLHDSSRDGCAASDLDGRILESNAAFRAMLGYTEKQLRRLTYEDITPEEWRATEAQIIKLHLNSLWDLCDITILNMIR